MLQNYRLYQSMSIIVFVISALLTVILFSSATVGIFALIVSASMAIVFESLKLGFGLQALLNTSLSSPIRAGLGVISFCLICVSILASSAYIENQANKTKNQQIKTSAQYKQAEQARNIQQDLYNSKKAEIASLENLKIKQQQDGEVIVNNMPKNYIDRRNQQRQDTQKLIASTQNIINNKSAELSQIASTLQTPIDTKNLNVVSDKGYLSMFQIISEQINNSDEYKDKPTDPYTLQMYFFLFCGIVFELSGYLCAYLSQTLKYKPNVKLRPKTPETLVNTNTSKILKGKFTVKKAPVTAQKNNVIGFKPDHKPKSLESLINTDDYNKYVQYMITNAKNGFSPGYQDIARNVNIKMEIARAIKGELQRQGVVKVVGNRTLILKDAI